MTIKLCLIGIGNFGRYLSNKIKDIDDCEITHFYHPNSEKATALDAQKGTSDLKSALENVDGVIIASPNDIHYENLIVCLKADKHIFVEKPITSLYQDALKIKPLLKSDKVFMVGHNHRREACFRHAKKLLDENKIGYLISVYTNVSHGGAFSFNNNQWRYSKKRHREGPLITGGIHLLDTIHYLFGPVESLYAKIRNISKQTQAPDSNAVMMNLKNNNSVFLQSNYNMPSEDLFKIHGTEGTIYIERGKICLRMGRDQRINNEYVYSKPKEIEMESIDSIKIELLEFRDAIKNDKKVETGFDEAMNALILIEACYQSNINDTVIFLKDFEDYYEKNN